MEKIEFKSQVCTTRKQSQKLLQLGLRESTADCHWFYHLPTSTWCIVARPYDGIGTYYPAWSLHRLIEISLSLTDSPVAYCYTAGSKMGVTYNEVIDMIEWAISKGCFNKDYLEEEKNEKED